MNYLVCRVVRVKVFWLSHGPISRSAVVNLVIHVFSLGIWATLWFLASAAKSMANANAERRALLERVVALEVQLLGTGVLSPSRFKPDADRHLSHH